MIAREQDAIFALASGAGGAAIAVFRITEPGCAAAVKALVAGSEFPTRRAIVRNLLRPVSLEPIDRALIARSEAIRSFAGEDSVELKTYGWPGCCCPVSGLRFLRNLFGARLSTGKLTLHRMKASLTRSAPRPGRSNASPTKLPAEHLGRIRGNSRFAD